MSTTATTQKRPTVPGAVVVARRLATIKHMVTRDYVEPLRPLGNSEEIDFEAVGHNRFFTLNRPYALNALSHDMFYTMMKKADVSYKMPSRADRLGMARGPRRQHGDWRWRWAGIRSRGRHQR